MVQELLHIQHKEAVLTSTLGCTDTQGIAPGHRTASKEWTMAVQGTKCSVLNVRRQQYKRKTALKAI